MCEISNYPWVFPWQRRGQGDNQTSLTTQRGTGDNLQDNVPYQIRPVIHRSLILRFSLLVSVLSCCQIAYLSKTGSYPNPTQPIVKLYKLILLIKAVIPGNLSSLLFFEACNGGIERPTLLQTVVIVISPWWDSIIYEIVRRVIWDEKKKVTLYALTSHVQSVQVYLMHTYCTVFSEHRQTFGILSRFSQLKNFCFPGRPATGPALASVGCLTWTDTPWPGPGPSPRPWARSTSRTTAWTTPSSSATSSCSRTGSWRQWTLCTR